VSGHLRRKRLLAIFSVLQMSSNLLICSTLRPRQNFDQTYQHDLEG
jgi:hypothetical protein